MPFDMIFFKDMVTYVVITFKSIEALRSLDSRKVNI